MGHIEDQRAYTPPPVIKRKDQVAQKQKRITNDQFAKKLDKQEHSKDSLSQERDGSKASSSKEEASNGSTFLNSRELSKERQFF